MMKKEDWRLLSLSQSKMKEKKQYRTMILIWKKWRAKCKHQSQRFQRLIEHSLTVGQSKTMIPCYKIWSHH
jgi:hypothetical protein